MQKLFINKDCLKVQAVSQFFFSILIPYVGGGQSFGIATAGLEEKATACQMLVCYAKELGGQFEEYIEQVTKLMVPLLKFYFHDSVRCSAAQSIAPLVKCTFQVRRTFKIDK